MPAELIAAAVNLDLRAIKSSRTEPIVAGTGFPFAIAEVKSREALTAVWWIMDSFSKWTKIMAMR